MFTTFYMEDIATECGREFKNILPKQLTLSKLLDVDFTDLLLKQKLYCISDLSIISIIIKKKKRLSEKACYIHNKIPIKINLNYDRKIVIIIYTLSIHSKIIAKKLTW